MLRTILCVLLLSASAVAVCQNDPNNDPDWSLFMTDPDVNVNEVVELFNQRWEGRPMVKGNGYKPFKRWEHLMLGRTGPDGTLPSAGDLRREFNSALAMKMQRSTNGNWHNLGPILDMQTSRANIPGVGRINHVAFHPSDPNIIFCGAPAGGVWRSYDGGQSWESNTDDLPTLGVSAIAFDHFNPDIVYIGTGDRDAGDAPGMGVMKSTDGGLSWEFVNTGMEDYTVGDIVCDPENPGTVIAATRYGMHRSTDYGETWELTSNSMYYKQVLFKPENSQIVYATAQGRFFRSEDNGQNWTYITDGITQATRFVLGVTPADPERVYVCSATTYEFRAFYQSTDGGLSFTEMSDEPNILGWSADGSSSGGQAWFDLCMEVDPNVPDRVFVGGIRMKVSNDGGASWSDIQNSYLHVDHHWLKFSPHDQQLYLGNDGGIYRYQNQTQWVDISEGIVTGQIYKFGQAPFTANNALSGYQDNGTMEFNGVNWKRTGGADGFECQYDPEDEGILYNSIYYGQIYRTNSTVSNQKICGEGELGINEAGAWSSPWTVSQYNTNTMFVGLKNLWRSKNIKHEVRDSIVWEKLSNNLGGNNLTNISNLELHRADSNIVYVSKGSRRLFRTDNANAPADEVVWTDLSNLLPWVQVPVTAIASHPTDSATVLIGFDNLVYRSIDAGETWEEFNGSMPELTINSIVYDLFEDEGIYAGTDQGVYYRNASMDDWESFSNGLPLGVRVTELEIYYSPDGQHRLRASTYGRGMWESDLYGAESNNFGPTAWLQNPDGGLEVYGDFTLNAGFYRQLQNVSVSGFEGGDVSIENASIADIAPEADYFSITVSPQEYGPLTIVIPSGVASDEDGLENYASDTLRLVYRETPLPFGPLGPGGVGDSDDIHLWIRGDGDVFTDNALTPASADGQAVARWGDMSGNDRLVLQNDADDRPLFRTGENGINGRPVIEFNGENSYLLAEDIPSSVDFSVWSVARSNGNEWNEHGWLASARQDNGFILHPWKNSNLFNVTAIDGAGDYHSAPQEWIVDAGQTQWYGLVYSYLPGFQNLQMLINGSDKHYPAQNHGERQAGDLLSVKYGWDFDERFGDGQIAEHAIYSRRIYNTHRIIIANYLAAKYGIDIDPELRYNRSDMPNDVAGIGRMRSYDLHEDAQGTGDIRILNADDLENGEFLFWGHDGEDLSWVVDGYPLVSPHVNRTWAYEQEGEVGNVELRIYLPELMSLSEGMGVIVTANEDFFPGVDASFYPLTDMGDYLVANIDFEASGVFTFGTFPEVGVENLSRASLAVFPNPANEVLNVRIGQVQAEGAWLHVFDAAGRSVVRIRPAGREHQIDLSDFAPGMYTLVLEKEGQRQLARFVKY